MVFWKRSEKVLKERMKIVSLASAPIAAIPLPGLEDIEINIGIVVEEVLHYKRVFGLVDLDETVISQLKIKKLLVDKADLRAVVLAQKVENAGKFMIVASALNIVPVIRSIMSPIPTMVIVYKLLNRFLHDFTDDARAVNDLITKKT